MLQNHLRFVVDDIPATATLGACRWISRAKWRCAYGLVFADGELFLSKMVLRRQRDGLIGWRLVDELPVRFPDEPVVIVP